MPQHSGYLFPTMFTSPSILQHYTKFINCSKTKLEKLLGVGSFGGFISHLTCHQSTLFLFSNKFGLPSRVRTIAFAFLGCKAPISSTFVTCFSHDDHLIFLDAVTHVEIDISLFQIIVQKT
jgi:hypothetical protein